MTAAGPAIRVGARYQGPTGVGQGGWVAQRFAERIGVPVSISLRAPTPLDTDLTVTADGADRWRLSDPAGTTILIADRHDAHFADTTPVTVRDARAARSRFAEVVADHPAPHCFSCGVGDDTMHVHAAPVDGDRFATDWTAPAWARDEDGAVDPGVMWAALDCTAGWWVGFSRERRIVVTASFAAEVTAPIEPGATHALVAWSGDHDPEWDGRKRWAASAAFDADGRCVARSVSFWISVG